MYDFQSETITSAADYRRRFAAANVTRGRKTHKPHSPPRERRATAVPYRRELRRVAGNRIRYDVSLRSKSITSVHCFIGEGSRRRRDRKEEEHKAALAVKGA